MSDYKEKYHALVRQASLDPLRFSMFDVWEALRLAEERIVADAVWHRSTSHKLIADIARKRAADHPQKCAVIGLAEIEAIDKVSNAASHSSTVTKEKP